MKLDTQAMRASNESPEMQLSKAFQMACMLEPSQVITDGQIHRYHANGQKGYSNESGWYVLFRDGNYLNGAFGDWSRGIECKFNSVGSEPLSAAEREVMARRMAEAAAKATAERQARQESVSQICTKLWDSYQDATALNPYVVRKGIKSSYGARSDGGNLVLPLRDKTGKIWSLQTIDGDGNKKFYPGGRTKGLFGCVGQDPEYIAEGFATAASVYEATGKGCIFAFNAGNLPDVSEQFPSFTIVADNDASHTGEDYAKKCKNPYILIPVVGMDANDYATEYGIEELKKILVKTKHKACHLEDWIQNIPPRQWIIKNWVLKGPAFQMTFGASGSGKTFVNIDRLMRAGANGFNVMYLCGEGPQSAKARCKVWIQQHPEVDLKELSQHVLIVEEEFKLDTPEGINLIYDIVDDYEFKPDFICIDTLICFMSGDENDTQAANQFITYCKEVYNHYQCCLLLTHHTGLSEDAQRRARGSSAFKGALDMQDFVEKKDERIILSQMKNKGGRIQESITYVLEDHEVQGLYEEDGSLQSCAVLVPTEPQDEETVKIDKKTQQTINVFNQCGFVEDGKAYMLEEDLRSYIRDCYILENPQKPDETDERFEDRTNNGVRQRRFQFVKDNPMLKVAAKDEKGNPVRYEAVNKEIEHMMLPVFTMNLISKNGVISRYHNVTITAITQGV